MYFFMFSCILKLDTEACSPPTCCASTPAAWYSQLSKPAHRVEEGKLTNTQPVCLLNQLSPLNKRIVFLSLSAQFI